MADSDLLKLYSDRILALAADIPHLGRLASPDGSGSRRAPLCGSSVTVDVTLAEDGRIDRLGQEVRACALGQASAAIAGAVLPGRTLAEVTRACDELAAMLGQGGPPPAAPFEGYEVLTPARDFRNRHASILLVLQAAADAMAAAQGADATTGRASPVAPNRA